MIKFLFSIFLILVSVGTIHLALKESDGKARNKVMFGLFYVSCVSSAALMILAFLTIFF